MTYNKKISIIIPTTRIDAVVKTIQSIVMQIGNYDYEIIVVGRDLSELKDRFSDTNIVLVNERNLCLPSKSRNIGASLAKGHILLFLDDDCEAAKGWLDNSVEVFNDISVGVVTGKVLGKSDRFFAQCVDLNFYLQQGNEKKELNRFSSITFGIRKNLFCQLGGFDEHIAVTEDIDFSKRVINEGYKIIYSPDIVVIHDHKRDSFVRLLHYQYQSGLLSGLLVSMKHKNDWKDNIRVTFNSCYFFLILPLAIWSTYKQLVCFAKLKIYIFLFLPFIFLSNLCYQFGVFKWTVSYKNK